jgi:hypothetical protein
MNDRKIKKTSYKKTCSVFMQTKYLGTWIKKKKKASRLTKYVPRMLNDSCNQMHIFIIFMDLRCHDPDGLTEKRTWTISQA